MLIVEHQPFLLGWAVGLVPELCLMFSLAAGLDIGDVVDPSGTGTGDNISGESGFGECSGLCISGIRLMGLLGELGWAFVTCVWQWGA